jgi:hypothetical protein
MNHIDSKIAEQLIAKAGHGHWEKLSYGELRHCLNYLANRINHADSLRLSYREVMTMQRDRNGIVARMNQF